MRILKCCLWFLVLILSLCYCVISLAQSEAGTAQSAADVLLRSKVNYGAQDLRDPFAVPGASSNVNTSVETVEKKPLPELTVQGVIWGGNFPQAIINNKVLKVGDTIEGVKIQAIAKEGIIVLFDGSESLILSPAAGPGAGTKSQPPTK